MPECFHVFSPNKINQKGLYPSQPHRARTPMWLIYNGYYENDLLNPIHQVNIREQNKRVKFLLPTSTAIFGITVQICHLRLLQLGFISL